MHVASLTDEERELKKFDHLYAAMRHIDNGFSFIVVDPLDTTKPLLQRLYKGFRYSLSDYWHKKEIQSLRPYGNLIAETFSRQFSFDLGYIVRCRELKQRVSLLLDDNHLPTDDLILPCSTFPLESLPQSYLSYWARLNRNCAYADLTDADKATAQTTYRDDLSRKF